MIVGIRVDASPTMGLGHLVRCLSLAQALTRSGARVFFLTRDLGIDSAARIAAAGFPAHQLRSAPNGWTPPSGAPPHAQWAGLSAVDDARESAEAMAAQGPDWVVVDHYAFDASWHRIVAGATGARLAAVDDLADRDFDVDLLVDHNLDRGTGKYLGRVPARTRQLLGPRHALIGARFTRARPHVPSGSMKSVGIFMGGVDTHGMSVIAWRACRRVARFDGAIEIVTTSANARLEDVRKQIANDPLTTLNVDLPDLADFFARHDLQVGAGGGASWERCSVGAPTLLLVLAENQRSVVPALSEAGVVAALPGLETPSEESIGRAVATLAREPGRLASMSSAGRRLVDGRGAERVALAMTSSRLCTRPACLADAETMYRWRNDPTTRAVSRDSAEISLQNHTQWLETALKDSSRMLLIGHVGDIDVGVVRLDFAGDEALVSIYVDPALHGLGLGTPLLAAGEVAAATRLSRTATFVADVLHHNPVSRRLFEASGYRFDGTRGRKPAINVLAPAGIAPP